MTWVEALPALTGFAYVLAAVGYWRQGQRGLAVAYAGYAAANVGLVMAAVAGRR